jgi:hypothetical protein
MCGHQEISKKKTINSLRNTVSFFGRFFHTFCPDSSALQSKFFFFGRFFHHTSAACSCPNHHLRLPPVAMTPFLVPPPLLVRVATKVPVLLVKFYE